MPGKIAHPHSKISGNEGGFKEFRIEELFEAQTGDVDLQQIDINGKGNIFINSGLENCGIKGKTDRKAKIFPPNTLTVDFWGNSYYRSFEYKMATHNHVFSLFPKYKMNECIGLYITSQMNYLKKIFSYGNMGTWTRIKEQMIFLPTTKNGNIDFSYMEKYIEELQQQQHNKIETFLKNIGLNNCELTRKEKDCINGKNTVFEKITIGDLFDIHPTKAYRATNKDLFHIDGKIPVVANSSVDNGIGGWTKLNATETGNKIVFSDTTTSDSIFYQPNNFVGYPHVQGLYPYLNKWNENSLLYFVSCFRKSAFGRFNYGLKFTRVIAKQMNVILPIKHNGEIDYDFMETFISAQKKLVAQKVVRWLEQQNINENILKIEESTIEQVLPMAADQKKKYTT